MKFKEKLALERFEQVFEGPVTGHFHTPQEIKATFLYAFMCGFDEALNVLGYPMEVGDEEVQ